MAEKSICVFCGARSGNHPDFEQAAVDFGAMLGRKNWRLVYGAGDVGLMGTVARSAQANSADTFGVIPTHLLHAEVGKQDLTSFVITENMHERKKVMFMNSDAVVVLPGGAGSLDEFFEVLTWAQLGLHQKPIILINISGYWDPLITMLDHIIASGFADPSLTSLFSVAPTVQDAEAYLS